MKGRGFTKIFPLIYVPSVIIRFIFSHWMVIYIKMQLLLDKRKQNHCFLSKRENLQSAILFILSTATVIIAQTNLMESPFADIVCCTTKLKSHFCFYVTLYLNGVIWRHITFFYDDFGALYHVASHHIKIEIKSLFVHFRYAVFVSNM